MIVSFGDRRTERLYDGGRVKGFPPESLKVAWRKLDMLNRAHTLEDLRIPPANHLEALKGDLQGFHSIRVNDRWRLVFQWRDGNAEDVRLTDYH
jgi:proteic killer suppression protein